MGDLEAAGVEVDVVPAQPEDFERHLVVSFPDKAPAKLKDAVQVV